MQRYPNKPDLGTSQIGALAQILRKLVRIWLVIFRPLADPAVINNISGSRQTPLLSIDAAAIARCSLLRSTRALFDERVPLTAVGTLAEPLARLMAAVLADEGRFLLLNC